MKIAVLAGSGASTAILLNYLVQHGFEDLFIIREEGPSENCDVARARTPLGLGENVLAGCVRGDVTADH